MLNLTKSYNKKYIIGILFLLPFLLPIFISNPYYIHSIICKVIIYTIFILSLDIIVGYFGDISIGHAGFFAVGAYCVAILTVPKGFNFESSIKYYFELPFIIALIIGVIIAGLFGYLLSIPALRLKGPYLAIVTIAYGSLIVSFINQEERITNGTKGIMLKNLSIAGISFSGNNYFYILYPILIFIIFIHNNLINSFWGRIFEAIKYSEPASAICGISKKYYKTWGIAISCALAGLAGGLFVQLDSYVAPNTFSYSFSIEVLIALIIGGVQSIRGNLLGALVTVILPDLFNEFNQYRLLFYGIILLIILYYLPSGLSSLIKKGLEKFFKKNNSDINKLNLEKLENSKFSLQDFLLNNEIKQNETLLEVNNLTLKFGGLTAVDNLDINLKSYTIHGLIGPNGSGKSSTINAISGIYKPTTGTIVIQKNNSITNLETYKIAQKGLVRTFQNLQIFGGLTVIKNVMVGLHLSFKTPLYKVLLGLKNKEENSMLIVAYNLLKFVGLEKEAFKNAGNLSYGKARFLEIARALASKPKIILLDEPAAGLTSNEISEMGKMINKIKDLGIAVLIVEHHMDMIMEICDEITVLNFGKKIAYGNPKSIQENKEVIKSYLGSEIN